MILSSLPRLLSHEKLSESTLIFPFFDIHPKSPLGRSPAKAPTPAGQPSETKRSPPKALSARPGRAGCSPARPPKTFVNPARPLFQRPDLLHPPQCPGLPKHPPPARYQLARMLNHSVQPPPLAQNSNSPGHRLFKVPAGADSSHSASHWPRGPHLPQNQP